MALAGLSFHLPAFHPSKPLKQLVPHIPAPAPQTGRALAEGWVSALPVHPHLPHPREPRCRPVRDRDSVLSHPNLSHTHLPPYLVLLQHTWIEEGHWQREG